MTVPKPLLWKDVEPVWIVLEHAFRSECPDLPDEAFFDPATIPRPRQKRAAALWEAYRLAWSASARFRRSAQKKKAKAAGSGEIFFDDSLVDAAIESLQRAQAAVRNATEYLERAADLAAKEAARLGFNKALIKSDRSRVEAAESVRGNVEELLAELTTFGGIPQARTRGDWDKFVSLSAAKLLDAGFSSRDVAALLTGTKPDKVDRAMLERFRQRVRRRENSDT